MMDMLWRTLIAFVPPDLSPHYLLALGEPVLESLGMTAGAMTIAFAICLPVGLAIGTEAPGARSLERFLAGFRAIPDLTLAILCVVMFGIGSGAGLLALALFYTGAVSKMFGDLLRTAPVGPVQALRAVGAGRVQLALFGLLPLKSSDLLTYGSYEFESAIRASVIIGAVGGGGLGSELVGTLASLDYQRATTLILILILIVAAVDRGTVLLRRYPRLLWLLLPLGLAGLWAYVPRLIAFSHAVHTFAAMFPPTLAARDVARLPSLLAETLWIAVAGTTFAVVFALPLGLASARNVASPLLAAPVRRLLEILRAVPEIALMEWWDGRPGFHAEPWRAEPILAITPVHHSWAAETSISRAKLVTEPLIGGEPGTGTGRILRDYLGQSRPLPRPVVELGSTEAVKRAVIAGLGASVVLALAVVEETKTGRLIARPLKPALHKPLYLIWREDVPVHHPLIVYLRRAAMLH